MFSRLFSEPKFVVNGRYVTENFQASLKVARAEFQKLVSESKPARVEIRCGRKLLFTICDRKPK